MGRVDSELMVKEILAGIIERAAQPWQLGLDVITEEDQSKFQNCRAYGTQSGTNGSNGYLFCDKLWDWLA